MAPQWSPLEVISLDINPGGFTCVGRTQKNKRCSNTINARGRQKASDLINRMATVTASSVDDEDLSQLAALILCNRYHSTRAYSQVGQMVRLWRSLITQAFPVHHPPEPQILAEERVRHDPVEEEREHPMNQPPPQQMPAEELDGRGIVREPLEQRHQLPNQQEDRIAVLEREGHALLEQLEVIGRQIRADRQRRNVVRQERQPQQAQQAQRQGRQAQDLMRDFEAPGVAIQDAAVLVQAAAPIRARANAHPPPIPPHVPIQLPAADRRAVAAPMPASPVGRALEPAAVLPRPEHVVAEAPHPARPRHAVARPLQEIPAIANFPVSGAALNVPPRPIPAPLADDHPPRPVPQQPRPQLPDRAAPAAIPLVIPPAIRPAAVAPVLVPEIQDDNHIAPRRPRFVRQRPVEEDDCPVCFESITPGQLHVHCTMRPQRALQLLGPVGAAEDKRRREFPGCEVYLVVCVVRFPLTIRVEPNFWITAGQSSTQLELEELVAVQSHFFGF